MALEGKDKMQFEKSTQFKNNQGYALTEKKLIIFLLS